MEFEQTKSSIESFEQDIYNDLKNFENLPSEIRQQKIRHIEDSILSMEEYIKDAMIASYTDANTTQIQIYLKEKQKSLESLKTRYQNALQRQSLMSGVHLNIKEGESQIYIDQRKRVENMGNLNDSIISGMANALDIGNDVISEVDRQREVGESMQNHLDKGNITLDETESNLRRIRIRRIKKLIITWIVVILALAFVIVFFYFVFRPVE